MNDTGENSGIELSKEDIQKMEDICNTFGKIMEGMSGPQIALIFSACLSSWLSVHAESREQSMNVLDFVFDKAREGIIGAEHSGRASWSIPEGEPN